MPRQSVGRGCLDVTSVTLSQYVISVQTRVIYCDDKEPGLELEQNAA